MVMRLYREIIIDRAGAKSMLYRPCTTISKVDFAHHEESHARDSVSVDCGIIYSILIATFN